MNPGLLAALLLVLAYLVGATPTSFWVGRVVHGVDLRTKGSGNLGATNALRVLGWKSALPVLLVDVAKGAIPVVYFPPLLGPAFGGSGWAVAFGVAAILGHVFSFWVNFHGGKGVATGAGVFLALSPASVGVAFLVWLGVLGATRYVSLASVVAALSLPIAYRFLAPAPDPTLTGLTLAVALFVVWTHRANLRRLLRGEESRMGRSAS